MAEIIIFQGWWNAKARRRSGRRRGRRGRARRGGGARGCAQIGCGREECHRLLVPQLLREGARDAVGTPCISLLSMT